MASFRETLTDNFGRVKIFNLLEVLPALVGIGWSGFALWQGDFTLVNIWITLVCMATSGYLMFLRMISFVVGVTMMVSSFLPILQMLKENER
jgi:hypothetical protein